MKNHVSKVSSKSPYKIQACEHTQSSPFYFMVDGYGTAHILVLFIVITIYITWHENKIQMYLESFYFTFHIFVNKPWFGITIVWLVYSNQKVLIYGFGFFLRLFYLSYVKCELTDSCWTCCWGMSTGTRGRTQCERWNA